MTSATTRTSHSKQALVPNTRLLAVIYEVSCVLAGTVLDAIRGARARGLIQRRRVVARPRHGRHLCLEQLQYLHVLVYAGAQLEVGVLRRSRDCDWRFQSPRLHNDVALWPTGPFVAVARARGANLRNLDLTDDLPAILLELLFLVSELVGHGEERLHLL